MDPEKSVCAGKLVNTQHNQQKREDDSLLGYGVGLSSNFLRCSQSSEASSAAYRSPTNEEGRKQDWDPDVMLNNLFFLERKIHQLQDLVHLMVGRKKNQVELVAQQQQLLKADLTSILVQLISTAGNLLPSVKLGEVLFLPEMPCAPRYCDAVQETEPHHKNAEHEPKDDEGENLPHQILQVEKDEILAPHTHFCTICGKGFKRDANLRMHMRGHGDEYKTPEALAKPNKGSGLRTISTKRYSCPYAGCKRNKDHKKFQPLKTILCVKNHYKRTHCDKRYTCSRCHVKKFSVIADLKTHEKHCGKDKWLCSCGTTFSRKDKLFGHIVLFQGHTPALPFDEKGSFGAADLILNSTLHKFGRVEFNTSSDDPIESGIKNDRENIDDLFDHFSPMNFDTCNFGGFHEFPRPIFEDLEGSFSLFLPGSCN